MSGKEPHGEIIIVKRHDDEEHEHHSSAWKVAHADFMTAMMAFFLIMWLINVTDKDTRKAIANYFNPVDLASSITDVRGLNDPEDTKAKGTSSDGDKQSSLKNTTGRETGAGDDRQQGDKERAAFRDPYAVLNKLAGDADARAGGTPDAAVGDTGSPGTGAGDVNRDPFDPTYWQMSSGRQARNPQAKPSKVDQPSGRPDATTGAAKPGEPEKAQAEKAQAAAAQAAAAGKAARDLESELKQVVAATVGTPGAAPRVDVRATKEGLIVDLTDDLDFTMFPVGSAVPDARFVRAMGEIAKKLGARPGEIVIRGHTDARPFRSDTYDNWRLSSARAHMALYMLVRGGLDEKRVTAIEGLADRNLKNNADPNAPQNRRIEILLKAPS
ncbi:flagellar motor protein MotB [Xanthobacter sp.]|uniref:flagellar motor protein MotB n=1 Tax=Xanthobacter sp. TaxID=35809 RepID=UPI0035ADE352